MTGDQQEADEMQKDFGGGEGGPLCDGEHVKESASYLSLCFPAVLDWQILLH